MPSTGMTLTVDTVADAAYVTLSDSPIAQTETVNEDVNVDIDGGGEVVGVELLRIAAAVTVQELIQTGMRHSTAIRIVNALKTVRGQSFTQGADGMALNQRDLCPA